MTSLAPMWADNSRVTAVEAAGRAVGTAAYDAAGQVFDQAAEKANDIDSAYDAAVDDARQWLSGLNGDR